MIPEHVPLIIPNDWNVIWNNFTQSDPDNFYDEDYKFIWEFQEDIFYFRNEEKKRILDLGWYPSHKPEGRYNLVLILITDDENMPESWDKPLFTYRTRSIEKLQKKINWILKEVSLGNI